MKRALGRRRWRGGSAGYFRVTAVLAGFCLALCAQTEPKRPAFDIVSVKPTPPERANRLKWERCQGGGAYVVEGAPLLWTLEYAYHLGDADLVGVPAWLDSFSDTYDITGKAEGRVSEEQCRLMVQSLLADRFHLQIHHETKERQVYFLTVAKNGPKLQAVKADAVDSLGVRFNGRHPAILSEDQPAPGWTMARLAGFLDGILDDGHSVIDKTGLTGLYAFNLDYSRDGVERPLVGAALQDQLGLRLEATKAPVDVVAIDHIERPSGN